MFVHSHSTDFLGAQLENVLLTKAYTGAASEFANDLMVVSVEGLDILCMQQNTTSD